MAGGTPGPAGPSAAGIVAYQAGAGIARITISRPERHNSLTWAMMADLRSALARAKDDPEVKVVVLSGAGDQAFCAGADLGGMAPPNAGEAPEVVELHERRGQLAGIFTDLWALGKPTIARVRGYALAGGLGLALACDLVVAAEDAVFAAPEIDVGLWPYMVTVPLARSMLPKKALELMMTGRRVGAAEADGLGMVTRVVPVAGLDLAVDHLAATLAAKAPGAMRLGRDSFYRVWDQAAEPALAHLHALLGLAALTPEAREGLSAFAERRPPAWARAYPPPAPGPPTR